MTPSTRTRLEALHTRLADIDLGDAAVAEHGGTYNVRDVGPDWFKARAS